MKKRPDEARELLRKFAHRLRQPAAKIVTIGALRDARQKFRYSTWTFPPPMAEFVATAIEDYLSGKAPSLDAAFGLTKKRGRPVTKAAEHDALARRILSLRIEGKSWIEITGILGEDREDGGPDERTIRKIFRDRFVSLGAEEIARQLKADDELEAKPERRKRR